MMNFKFQTEIICKFFIKEVSVGCLDFVLVNKT